MASGLLSPTHIAVLMAVMLLIFGAKRLPETGRSLGRAMREFKEAITGHDASSGLNQPPGASGEQPDTARR